MYCAHVVTCAVPQGSAPSFSAHRWQQWHSACSYTVPEGSTPSLSAHRWQQWHRACSYTVPEGPTPSLSAHRWQQWHSACSYTCPQHHCIAVSEGFTVPRALSPKIFNLNGFVNHTIADLIHTMKGHVHTRSIHMEGYTRYVSYNAYIIRTISDYNDLFEIYFNTTYRHYN